LVIKVYHMASSFAVLIPKFYTNAAKSQKRGSESAFLTTPLPIGETICWFFDNDANARRFVLFSAFDKRGPQNPLGILDQQRDEPDYEPERDDGKA